MSAPAGKLTAADFSRVWQDGKNVDESGAKLDLTEHLKACAPWLRTSASHPSAAPAC